MDTIACLSSVEPPWVYLAVLKSDEPLPDLEAALPGFVIRRIDGKRCRTKEALLAEFARALDFPDYFGGNWDALEECLGDLEWLPAAGYVVIVGDADLVLPGQDEEFETLVSILQEAGRAWATPQSGAGPPRPFHVLFTVTPSQEKSRADWKMSVLRL